jgi:transcriptional regulator with XRE-family HTH domain
MTHPFGELSAQRQHLGAALRRLRVAAGLSGEQVAERTGLSQSRVSRIELGQQSAPLTVVERWAQATGATGTALAEVMDLAEAAATQAVSWRKAMARGLVRLQQDSRALEAGAGTILNFQSVSIPGLLQVPEYSRRVLAAGYPPPDAQEIAAAVAVRMDRQVILYDETRSFEFILSEAALRWRLGPPTLMRAQLDRIAVVAALDNVTVGVIPCAAEVNEWHDHGFNILEGRGGTGESVAHVETLTSGLTITDPADVAAYRTAFERLRAAAVFDEEAQQVITGVAQSLI